MIKVYKCKSPEYGIELSTDMYDDEVKPNNLLHLYFWKWSIYVEVPQFIKPHPVQAFNTYSKTFYTQYLHKRYGIHTFEDVVFINYGIYNDDWVRGSAINSRQKICNMNWKQFTFVRSTIYDKNFSVLWQEHDLDKSLDKTYGVDKWDFVEKMDSTNKFVYKFKDFDGEENVAACYITEREWHKGRKQFAWLRYLAKPLIRLTLEIEHSSEVGQGKGSYKGGIIGTGIDFTIDEPIESVFRRYCAKNNLSFIDEV